MKLAPLAMLLASCSYTAEAVDLIVHNAKISTFDGKSYSGFSVTDGRFDTLSRDDEALLKTRQASTLVIDAKGKRVIPGMNDSHLHVVREGRFYNTETRWEGVDSLEKGLALIRQSAKNTPPGQWVRVVGGWSPHQFKEKRMPTAEELTLAAPNTPVFVLHLYSGGVLNKKAMAVLGIDKNTQPPKGSYYEKDASGEPTGRLVADPNPAILYQTIAALPALSEKEQRNSSQHYYRKLLSLGVTSAVDAGGGGHLFPDNYQASSQLAASGELPLRVSFFLFPQVPGEELNHFTQWMSRYQANQNQHLHMDNGFVVEGGGELLVWKASDYENFQAERPDLGEGAEKELEQVVRLHLLQGWPFRIHATYDESITRMLDLFEKIDKTQQLSAVRWIIDHAETVSDHNLERIKKLGGAIAVQGRMAFAGEDFLARYGEAQTRRSPPLKKMLAMGIPVGLGTDGTRVSSFNPWATYYWAVSGKTVGGTVLYGEENRLDRLTALKLFTEGSAYLSGEERNKGQIAPGMYADFAVLNHDILTVPERQLLDTRAELTVVDGKIRYASKSAFPTHYQAPPEVLPAWSPVTMALD